MQRHQITFLLASLLLGCLPVYSDTATDTIADTSSSGNESTGTSVDPTTSGTPATSSSSSDPISTEGETTEAFTSTTGDETSGSSTGEVLPQPGEPFGPCKNPGGRLFCDESGPIFCIPVGDTGHVCAPACIKNACTIDFPGAGCTCLPSGVGIIPCTDSMTCPFDGMQCIDSICAYPD